MIYYADEKEALIHGLGIGGGRGRPKGSKNGQIMPGSAYMNGYQIRGSRAHSSDYTTIDYMRDRARKAYSAMNPYREETNSKHSVKMSPTEIELYSNVKGKYFGKGNIDLNNRPVVRNEDGTISTERSFSVNIDGLEYLLPTVINGQIVSEDEAIDYFFDTGEYLGAFDTVEEAEEYAEMLHNRQDWYYNQNKK